MALEFIAITLALLHFSIPLAYYLYAKTVWLKKPWDIKIDENYRPRVTIIIPTYNEAKLIAEKLDNIYSQDYPKNLVEVIVVDSASTDGTPEIVEKWAEGHRDLKLILVREETRRGKAYALNHALKYANSEVIVIADADAIWPRDALSKAIKWLSDPTVSAVSCLKKPFGPSVAVVEEGYRRYYNILRVAESKAHSTPIFHGELAVFKTELLKKVGGFPTDIGADDSYTATRIALTGFRAVIPEDLWIKERIPTESYFLWRVRRAQHLIQHFSKIMKTTKTHKTFKRILITESYIHLINPWILATSTALLMLSAIAYRNPVSWIFLTLGLLLLILKPYRTWITTQLCLIIGTIRNLYNKEIIWTKQNK